MSTNTLIAFVVGLMFLLCVVVVLGAFADRRGSRRVRVINTQAPPPQEDDTLVQKPWPETGGQ